MCASSASVFADGSKLRDRQTMLLRSLFGESPQESSVPQSSDAAASSPKVGEGMRTSCLSRSM